MGGDGSPVLAAPADVLAFWRAAGPDKWFCKDEAFDADISRHFLATYDTPEALVKDADKVLKEITKDEEVRLVGPLVFSAGRYTIRVTAEDMAHNTTSQEVALDVLP